VLEAALASNSQEGASSQHPAGPLPQVSDLPSITRTGDILVVAVGYPQLVKREWVKPGAVVIDVGINVISPEPAAAGDGSTHDGDQPLQMQHPKQLPGTGHAVAAMPTAPAAATAAASSRVSGGEVEGHAVAPPPAGSVAAYLRDEYPEEGAQLQQPWHVVGDVDFCDVAQVASAITPVPGGVGPMTIAAVLHNTVLAARCNLGLDRYDSE
jgi:hypothetical protein